MIAAVAGARYAEVQTYFDQLAARPGLPDQFEGASGLMFAVQGCGLYLLSATRDWVAARPDSKAAQFMLGVDVRPGRFGSARRPVRQSNQQRSVRIVRAAFGRCGTVAEPLMREDDFYGLAASQAMLGGYCPDRPVR